MRIPERQIEEIRNSADIVDIISGYVQLRKRGRNLIGLCPFHQEKTPSFTVSEEKQIFHCFGCGNGGNVYKFLMDFKHISFVEAVEEIAEHLGIQIERDSVPFDAQQNELEELYEINVLAARFFSDNLLKSNDGKEARDYLSRRQIKTATQKIFGIGFAPFGWNNFLQHAKENKIDLSKAKQLGLIDTKDNTEYYDKFRGRIIFPVFSPNGRVIAFGGRVFEQTENAAKYLNSPESQLYSKRRSLYGLFHSKDEIRKLDKAILVEGYMDLVSLYQSGIKNVVASSGTSLTDEQVQLLSRFTKNIYILFDADSAGQKAAVRSIEILLKQDFEVKVVTLPKGEDPDSYINNFGKEEFDKRVSAAQNFIEFQSMQFEEAGMFSDPNETTKAIRELVKTLALVNDELKRNLLLKSVSKKFGLREKLIESELLSFINQNIQKNSKVPRQEISEEVSRVKNGLPLSVSKRDENPYEKEIVRLLFSGDVHIIEHIFERVSVHDFTNENYRTFAEIVNSAYDLGKTSPADIIDLIQDEEGRKFIRSISLAETTISRKWDDISFNGKIEKDTLEHAEETVRNYQLFQIDQQIKENNKIISDSRDELLHLELLNRNKELQDEKKQILNERKPKE